MNWTQLATVAAMIAALSFLLLQSRTRFWGRGDSLNSFVFAVCIVALSLAGFIRRSWSNSVAEAMLIPIWALIAVTFIHRTFHLLASSHWRRDDPPNRSRHVTPQQEDPPHPRVLSAVARWRPHRHARSRRRTRLAGGGR